MLTLSTFSVIFKPQSQRQRQSDPNDESDALKEPQGLLLVALSSFMLLEVRDC